MRHRNTKAILNRPADQRKALKRSLVTSLFLHGAVKTTEAKAKALVSEAEKLITRAKRKVTKNEDMNAVRDLNQVLYSEDASKKALTYIKETKKDSGYTRLTRIKYRDGDNALIVMVELISDK